MRSLTLYLALLEGPKNTLLTWKPKICENQGSLGFNHLRLTGTNRIVHLAIATRQVVK